MMNKILIVSAIVLLATSVLFDVNYLNYSKPIEHRDHNLITLKKFKGLKQINESLNGENEFAFIVTEIKIRKKGDKYDIKALFHPSRSYVYKDNIIGDKNLLTHELYHFHITEYIARKLRKEVQYKKNIDINKLLKKYKTEEDILQQQYDEETYHSYYVGEQLKWQHKIDSLLNTLENYQ